MASREQGNSHRSHPRQPLRLHGAVFVSFVALAVSAIQCEDPTSSPTEHRDSNSGQQAASGPTKSKPVTPAASATAPSQPTKPVEKAVVVEILEENSDTFKRPLMVGGAVAFTEPFRVVDKTVLLDPRAAKTTDSQVLDEFSLILEKPKRPLAQCGVLVLHTIQYNGVGRRGPSRDYYAFEKLPVGVPMPAAPGGAKFQHDPARSPLPFAIAVEHIRILGDKPTKLALAAGEGGKLSVIFGDKTVLLAAGETAKLHQRAQQIAVTEKGLRNDQVRWKGKAPANPAKYLYPPRDHGVAKFTTRISIRYLGVCPVATAPEAKVGGPK